LVIGRKSLKAVTILFWPAVGICRAVVDVKTTLQFVEYAIARDDVIVVSTQHIR